MEVVLDAQAWQQASVALFLSLKVASWATLWALLLGVSAAYILTRREFWGKGVVEALLTLPLVLPPTVLGYYLLVLLGQRDWLGHWLLQTLGLRLIFTTQAAIIAATVVSFPLVFKAAQTALETVDARLEAAARVLGLTELEVFFRVTLPLAWPGIASGLLLGFARAMGEFGATLMVAGSIPGRTQTLSIAIYEAVQAGQDAQAAWLVLVVSGVCVVTLFCARYLLLRCTVMDRCAGA